MAGSSTRKPPDATYSDVEAAPPDRVAELVDGQLYLWPRPRLRHARSAGRLFRRLAAAYEDGLDGPGGWWFLPEPELRFAGNALVPDLAGWRRERMPEIPDVTYSELAPDWLCEVLSPRTQDFNRGTKLTAYAEARVPHVWLVEPAARALEVLGREGGRFEPIAVHRGDAVVRAEPFLELALDLAPLWTEAR